MFFYKYVYIYKRVHFPHVGDWLSKVLVTCKVQDEFNNFKIVPTTVGKCVYLLDLIILGVFVFIHILFPQ